MLNKPEYVLYFTYLSIYSHPLCHFILNLNFVKRNLNFKRKQCNHLNWFKMVLYSYIKTTECLIMIVVSGYRNAWLKFVHSAQISRFISNKIILIWNCLKSCLWVSLSSNMQIFFITDLKITARINRLMFHQDSIITCHQVFFFLWC